MIKKLLIANRGEIACRIIRTARKLGIETVAVYSEADKLAMHVRAADQSVCIGPPPSAESYLNQEALLNAAITTAADAIHPGYGFLAENAEFARRCETAGIIFVGPSASAIEAMGLKGVARSKMEAAGVPVLKGINKLTDANLSAVADIGYPVLIKPEAGGGGKGMKIVHHEKDLPAAVDSARREALSAFGNDSLMAERYLLNPRHIEIQIFADQQGNCVHLFERDCSLQRRHQKIIEESPAPAFSEALRQQMGAAAVAAARTIAYQGAGTVEFLLSDNGDFFFMEMNTRLQVEHPVTEMITGIDLVEWQLRVASGMPLPCSQEQLTQFGHATEVRLYAEDPANDFLPVTGKLNHIEISEGNPAVRLDSGVTTGDSVSVYYDPMLFKLIVWGETRAASINLLNQALSTLRIAGVRTNRDFLCQLTAHEPFLEGALPTDYLDTHLSTVFTPPGEQEIASAAVQALLFIINEFTEVQSGLLSNGFRLNEPHLSRLDIDFQDQTLCIRYARLADGYSVSVGEHSFRTGFKTDPGYVVSGTADGVLVTSPSRTFEFTLTNIESGSLDDNGGVCAPMTGKVVSVLTASGASTRAGDPLIIIEAMKMEHTIRAPEDGTIGDIHYQEGDLVTEGAELLAFIAAE
ncbi:MAG: acetyl-CoA carboxylase biotin carboxylase subunit [Pseudomonadales bacterium]|nr:acetyl-CoA carboxylase biotin carboxylase subunit [Pseudomonadales bacterium]